MKATRSLLVTGLLVGAAVGLVLTMSAREGTSLAETAAVAPQAASESPVDATAPAQRPAALPVSLPATAAAGTLGLPDFSALAEALAPSVVNISTESE